jgi:hypothetical protein
MARQTPLPGPFHRGAARPGYGRDETTAVANALAQAIAQDENPRDDGQVVAQLMAHVDQRAAASRLGPVSV